MTMKKTKFWWIFKRWKSKKSQSVSTRDRREKRKVSSCFYSTNLKHDLKMVHKDIGKVKKDCWPPELACNRCFFSQNVLTATLTQQMFWKFLLLYMRKLTHLANLTRREKTLWDPIATVQTRKKKTLRDRIATEKTGRRKTLRDTIARAQTEEKGRYERKYWDEIQRDNAERLIAAMRRRG